MENLVSKPQVVLQLGPTDVLEDTILALQQLRFRLSLHCGVFLLTVSSHASLAGLERTLRTLVEPGPGPGSVHLSEVEHNCPSSGLVVLTVRAAVPTVAVRYEEWSANSFWSLL